jgi:hypothetical protein
MTIQTNHRTDTLTASGGSGTLTGFSIPAGTGPAFSAYLNTSNQSITGSTWTKVTLNAEEFDTNNNFDSTTNYRFTPTVAGYYQINFCCNISYTSSAPGVILAAIYKNGTFNKQVNVQNASGATYGPYGGVSVTAVIYMNGSTDYIEGYAYSTSASAVVVYASYSTYMTGSLVRAA